MKFHPDIDMAQVDFEVNIITSFEGVTLEVGGDVETYWKSMAMPVVFTPQPNLSSWSHRSNLIGSAQTSPAVNSTDNMGGQVALTISSLRGCYIFAVVQVTRDLHPVVYSDWLLPGTDFDLGVSDVTLEQFEALSHRSGRRINPENDVMDTDWSSLLSRSMISLADLLKVCTTAIHSSFRSTSVSGFTFAYKYQLGIGLPVANNKKTPVHRISTGPQ